jgi:sugar phosphate isomerase/epimerase
MIDGRNKPSAGMSRRLALGMLGAGVLAGPAWAKADPDEAILGTWPVGVQLYTVMAQLRQDLPGTLKQLKTTGYDAVETAGLQGLGAQAFRKQLDDNGLVCRSAHVSMGELLGGLDQKIDDARTLGAQWLVCASPKPPKPIVLGGDWVKAMREAMTLDAWKANADDLARIAPLVTKAGLKLAYHNHFMEFIDHGGVCGYDLITAVDPEHLRLELDLGWVKVGGRDPLATVKRYGRRIDMLHIKDFAVDASQALGYRCVEVGQGIIDWPPVLKQARAQGVKYIFVEQEPPYVRPIFASLATTRDYLVRL